MIELTKIHADAVMKLMVTLRRLNLAKKPTGQYSDTAEVFNVWNFAKKYGIVLDDEQK